MSYYPRTEYEMTQADLDTILDACRPTPAMFLSGGVPLGGSPQDNANAAWSALGAKMGFDAMTVRPIQGKGNRFFSAVPSETEEQRGVRLACEAEAKRLAEIARLESVLTDTHKAIAALKGSTS